MGLTREQATFYWLNISGGGIGLVLLFFTTLLSRNAKKHPVLLNLYFCCIFEAYLACLLFFVGRYTREEGGESIPQVKAGSPLCVVQALLFTPTPVLLAGAAFALVFHVFLAVYSLSSTRPAFESRVQSHILVAIPYIFYVITSIPIIITGTRNQLAAKPHLLYCSLDLPFVPYFIGIFTGAIIMTSLVLKVWTILLLKRDYTRILARSVYDIPLLLRVALFAAYMVITLAMSMECVQDLTAVVPDLFVSSVPMMLLIVFGSHKDVFSSWKLAFITISSQLALKWHGVPPIRRPQGTNESMAMQASVQASVSEDESFWQITPPHGSSPVYLPEFLGLLGSNRSKMGCQTYTEDGKKSPVRARSDPSPDQESKSFVPHSVRRHSWAPEAPEAPDDRLKLSLGPAESYMPNHPPPSFQYMHRSSKLDTTCRREEPPVLREQLLVSSPQHTPWRSLPDPHFPSP